MRPQLSPTIGNFLLAGRLLLAFVCLAAGVHAHEVHLPPGFVFEEEFITGLTGPTDLKIAPDGRIFVTEKGGAVRIIENGQLLDAPFYTVQTQTAAERGLNGIALDPDFDSNGYVYLYYTLQNERRNIIARVTAAGNTAIPQSEVELMRLDEMWAGFHNGGAMGFDDSGMLIVCVGDGTGFVAGEDIESTLGKILRIRPDGGIPTDNPFYNQLTGNERAIAAYGVRNPYTMAISRLTGRIFFNDVGNVAYEEVNEFIMGSNYGWQFVEGPLGNGVPPDSNYRDPIYAYDHDFGCAVVGAAFYEPDVSLFPANYFGDYFFLDFCEGKLMVMDPDNFEVEIFGTGLENGYNNLVASPDGYLYLVNFFENSFSRISYQGEAAAPLVSIQPQSQIVPVGEQVAFSVSAVGPELTYTWVRDGQEVQTGASATYDLGNAQMADDQTQIYVRITNPNGSILSEVATLTVVDGSRPTVQVQGVPATYKAGDTLTFAAVVSDPDQQAIPAADLTWWIDFHHDTHQHPAMAPLQGMYSGSFPIGTVGEVDTNVYYRVNLSVTDSSGLTGTGFADIQPEKVTMLLTSEPPGVTLSVDGLKATTNYPMRSVRNLTRVIEAPSYAVIGDSIYGFSQWWDGQDTLTRSFSAEDQTISLSYVGLKEYFNAYPASGNMEVFTDTGARRQHYRAVQVSHVKENWDVQSPFWHDIPAFPEDYWSVRWEGDIVAPVSDWYTFYLLHDGKVSFSLDGEMLIDQIRARDNQLQEDSVRIWLDSGDSLRLRVDYDHYIYVARVQLDWRYSVVGRHPVPFAQPHPPIVADKEGATIILFPNPVEDGNLYLCIGDAAGVPDNFKVEVYDDRGARHYIDQLRHTAPESKSWLPTGLDRYLIPVGDLRPGLYMLKIRYEGIEHVRKFLKR